MIEKNALTLLEQNVNHDNGALLLAEGEEEGEGEGDDDIDDAIDSSSI